PRVSDTPTGITHKIFYTIPGNYGAWDLPTKADVLLNKNTGSNKEEIWLKVNEEVVPEVISFSVEGIEGESQQAGPKGANIRYETNLAGTIRVTIEPDVTANPYIDFEPRTLIGAAHAGPDNILYWDGLDGAGNPMDPGILPTKVTLQLQGGEVHFPYLDMEINPNGLIVERLNPQNFNNVMADGDRVYWDDSKITILGGTGANVPAPITVPITGDGESSNSNGHKWGSYSLYFLDK